MRFDTLDFELDVVVFPDGSWALQDREVLADRVVAGGLSTATVDRVLALGDEMVVALDAGRRPSDPRWADWTRPDGWRDARLPAGWSVG